MATMKQLEEAERDPNSVVTVGTFDGVHAGHRVLLNTVIQKAREKDARSVIVTFDPHPRDIINPGKSGIRMLTTLDERCDLLEEMGVDTMIVIPFDRDFSLMSSETFIRDIIWEKIGLKEFVIGYDHQFGKDRQGTIDTIKNLSEELGFDVHVVSRQEVGDKIVSSTKVRRALQENGNVELASKLLERPYILNGTVVHGDKRGKEIGYPTANIKPNHPNKAIPRNGVYAVRVKLDGSEYNGMMNIGVRPTFNGDEQTLEVHLFEFDRDIYGTSIQVQFINRIRDEKSFKGVDELKEQLDRDKQKSLSILTG